MKAYIAATTPKGYTKKVNGIGHIDGNRMEKCGQPLYFRPIRTLSHPNINQASSRQNATDRHGERNMYEEKGTRWTPCSGFVQSSSSCLDGGLDLYRGTPLPRTQSTPGSPCHGDADSKSSFSSITITARRVPQTASVSSRDIPEDSVSQAQGPMIRASNTGPAPALSSTHTPLYSVAGGDHEPVTLRKKPMIVKVTEYQAYRQGDGGTAARPPEFRHSYSDGDRHRNDPHVFQGRLGEARIESAQSCFNLDLPTSPTNSVFQGKLRGARADSVQSCSSLDLPTSPTNSVFQGKLRGARADLVQSCSSLDLPTSPTNSVFQGRLRGARVESLQSCSSLDLPSSSASSVLYLDKSLSVSLQESESRRKVHRSTLSLYLSGAAPTAAEEGPDRPRRTRSASGRLVPPSPASDKIGALAQNRWDLEHPGKVDSVAMSDGSSGSNARSCAVTPVLRGERQSRPEMARRGVKRDKEAHPRLADFEAQLPVCSQPQEWVAHEGPGMSCAHSSDPVVADMKQQRQSMPKISSTQASETAPDSRVALEQHAGNRPKSLPIEDVVLRSCENGSSRPSSWTESFPLSPSSTSYCLTLREALELYRPDFIRRSQGRVLALEERAKKRRASQNTVAVLEPAQPRGQRRRNCTRPHPLSDNLFKPRERSISQKDMQLRSKRIYDKLPEVTRRKQEEKRKVQSQTNRLRAEIFKKKLLDQVLQRNGD